MTTTDIERRRLEGIQLLSALDSDSPEVMDRVARLAARITGARSAAIHIIDADKQHRVASVNAPLDNHPRGDSMCRLVVESGEGIAVGDAAADPRFDYTSFTDGPDPVRYYASAPLRTDLYGVIGTVCAWDTEAHGDVEEDLALLADLAQLVVDQLHLDRVVRILEEEATTDPLTGLANRRLMHDRLREALHRRTRHGLEVVVAYIDLDGFKVINDTHGHEVGDQVLVHVADRLRSVARTDEIVGRLGGDEFLVVAGSGMDRQAAVERYTAALQARASTSAGELHVGASMGVAVARDDDTPLELIKRADALMFTAKRADGRGR